MSGRNLERRALNAFSDSETEDDSSKAESRSRSSVVTRSTRAVSHSTYSRSSQRNSSNHLKSNHFSTSTPIVSTGASVDTSWSSSNNNNDIHRKNTSLNSSQMDRLLVQESMFDRLRWVVCRYIYLKIISVISFDVWLLSRLRGNKTVLLLPLLLLLIPLWEYISSVAIISSDFPSSFSFLSSLSVPCQRFMEALQPCFLSLYASLSTIAGFFAALLQRSDEGAPYVSSPTPAEPGSKLWSVSQEQLESLVSQEFEKRMRLDRKIDVSYKQDLKAETARFQEELADLRQQVKLLQQLQNDQNFERSSHTKDSAERQKSAEHNINLVNLKLKALEDQLISFGDQQKLEKSSFAKDIEKVTLEISHAAAARTAAQENWNIKFKTLEDRFSQKLDIADFIASIEKHLVAAFRSVVDSDKTSAYFFFSEWLTTKSSEIRIVIEENLRKERSDRDSDTTKVVVEGLVRHYLESLKVSGKAEGATMSDDHFRKIVRDAILLYDADKTGMADYALESAGGSVISIKCTESYTENRGKFSILGLPWGSDQNSPRIAIQPDMQPGRCWSFVGSQGFLVVQLSYAIRPTRFSMEHIPRSLSPTGTIDSAPREFSVWGLESESDNEGMLLGRYSYEDNGNTLQYFSVENSPNIPISFIELKIHSNHGNLVYTCLYRFRVHGTKA